MGNPASAGDADQAVPALRVGGERRARPVADDPAADHHVRAAGELDRQPGMLLDQDDRHALARGERLDRLGELLDDDRRQPSVGSSISGRLACRPGCGRSPELLLACAAERIAAVPGSAKAGKPANGRSTVQGTGADRDPQMLAHAER